MGYQRATHCENATAITIGIHAKDLIYKQSIQRRLSGRQVNCVCKRKAHENFYQHAYTASSCLKVINASGHCTVDPSPFASIDLLATQRA